MEKQEVNDSRSSRRLLPPLHPSSFTTTNVPRAGNSYHHNHYSRLHPFQHNPASAAHFASQAGPGCKAGSSSSLQPPSLLSRATHVSAGVGGISNTAAQSHAIVPGSGCVTGSSSYQIPPSPQPQTHSSGGNSGGVVDGGSAACFQMPAPLSPAHMALDTNPMLGGDHPTFFSSSDPGLASVVDLAPPTCTQPPFSWSVDQASSESGLPATLLTQSTATVDFGLTEEYVLPPLAPTLSGPPPMQTTTAANLEAVQYVDLEGPDGHFINSSGRDWGSTSTKSPCPPLPQPYSSGYTCTTQAPTSLTSSSSLPAPGANFGVKKEAVDWSWGTSQLGKNNIIGGGSSSANSGVKEEPVYWSSWGTSQLGNNTIASSGSGSSSMSMPQPYSSGSTDLMVFGSIPNYLPSPVVAGFADGLFTQDEINKIMAEKGLAEIVHKNPKRVRSLLKNRVSAERSRQRRIMRESNLERLAKQLQQENESLSAIVQSMENKNNDLEAENNEIMIKLCGFQQETQMKHAQNETLDAEVRRLKLIVGEIKDSRVANSSYQERSLQTVPLEHPKKYNHRLAQLQQDQELRDLENFSMQ